MIEWEPIRDLLKKAYGTTMGKGCKPDTEQDMRAFEQKHNVNIPAAYRALLLEFGACNFGDPASGREVMDSGGSTDWCKLR
ncbi:SMI1/KNR4 family protein [Paenibacillus tundrae]|uniref:Knr4/Smi1-like domain-containing protein n=1 Tax=Paenibacillus tundrae TaxID=528187 RepID=A0ABT9WF84_9BACL|nr:SMI1/KNR4 family protein [Paenibacillus tundrae]MDQ0171899.1 hypothetical protein [Paenibacillus tundrae]